MNEDFPSILDISPDQKVDTAQSLCVNCEGTGTTNLMITKIPFFKEVIIASFRCEECGYKNSSIEFGGKLADLGVKMELNVTTPQMLNRYIIKSDFTTLRIPKLDLQIPPQTQKGSVNTIQGFLIKTREGLLEEQPVRKVQNPEVAQKIDEFCEKIQKFIDGKVLPFELHLDDPSGNAHIQNPNAPHDDPFIKIQRYHRTLQQLKEMGYGVTEFEEEKKEAQEAKQSTKGTQLAAQEGSMKGALDENNLKGEALEMSTQCHACGKDGTMKTCVSSIPYFKEIIIMAFNCEFCGFKNNEIKQGGGISEKAMRITLNVEQQSDMNRDLFKSETAVVKIPEIELQLAEGTLGSQYTTVEGLLKKIMQELGEKNPFVVGDSSKYEDNYDNFKKFITNLQGLINFEKKFTLILDDPLSNCWVYSELAPKPDPQIKREVYERTAEQNDDLGISAISES